jgi:DEAD/DEAH box helicase domain-containing protein
MAYKSLDDVLNRFQDRIIGVKSIDTRDAVFERLPAGLHPILKKGLTTMGIKHLYSHQARMYSEVEKGNNVIITTGTSSGKSLAFYLPVLQRIVEDPLSRALLIYPTKALAQDQKANLEKILQSIKSKSEIMVGVYDGDTPPSERKRIREHANIILTNPDMLNVSFLPYHNRHGFQEIFRNLDFVVLDELHVYRGAFGTHVAYLMRRLLRICDYHGVSPQFLCSSATIANPLELAQNICSRPFILIDDDGSFNSAKKLIFWQCPNNSDTITEVTSLIPDLVVNDITSITFCQSRRDVEVASREIKEILKQQHGIGNIQKRVSAYRSGLTPTERRSIELNLRTGILKGVI